MHSSVNVNTSHLGNTYGICTVNLDTSMGNIYHPLTIAHNEFNINSEFSGTTAGIYINTEFNNNHSKIFDNTITINSTFDAYGIKINGDNKTQVLPILVYTEISDNTINVTSLLRPAFGICGVVEGPFIAEIGENTITATMELPGYPNYPYYKSYGIYLENAKPQVEAPFIPDPENLFKDILKDIAWERVCNTLLAEIYDSQGEQSPLIATIYDNTLTVSSKHEAYGIFCTSYDTQYLDIMKNKMPYSSGEGGIIGKGESHGIRLETKDKDIDCIIDENIIYVKSEHEDAYGISCESSRHIFAEIGDVDKDNNITIRSDSNNAYGIWLKGNENVLGSITSNKMSGEIIGDDDAYGIYIKGGLIGVNTDETAKPFTISDNKLRVSSSLESAYGIKIESDFIFANIENNIMAGDSYSIIGEDEAYGIYIDANIDATTINDKSGIGSNESPLTISGNLMDVTDNAVGGKAYGIYIESGHYQTFANITNNINENKTKGITVKGEGEVGGIYLSEGYIGSLELPVTISGNLIDVMNITSNGSSAYGIRMKSGIRAGEYCDIYSKIFYNTITATSLGEEAYGILSEADGNLHMDIGNKEYGNTIVVAGLKDSYGISLKAGESLFANIKNEDIASVLSLYSNAFGISLEGINIGKYLDNAYPVKITENTINAYALLGGDAAGIFMMAPEGIINTEISENTMKITSDDSDAAGILLLAKEFADDSSDYANNPNITVEAPNGMAHNLIDAVVVKDLPELDNQINNGETSWIYLKAGDYSGGGPDTIKRNNVSLWGEHYEMFGIGGGDYPVLNMGIGEGHLSILNSDSSNSGVFGLKINVVDNISALGIYIESRNTERFVIRDNEISVTIDSTGNAFGIYASSLKGLTIEDCKIIVNNISDDFDNPDNTYGIYITGDDIGSSADSPLIISNNEIKVNYTKSLNNTSRNNVYGIYIEAENDIGSTESYETIDGEETLVSEAVSAEISNNTVNITTGIPDNDTWYMSHGETVGIYLKALNNITVGIKENYVNIKENNLKSYGSGVYYPMTGIYLEAGNDIGSKAKPVIIQDNNINLFRNNGSLNGIDIRTGNDAFIDIKGNDLNVTNIPIEKFYDQRFYGGSVAGIRLDFRNDLMGSINDNSIKICGYNYARAIDFFVSNYIGSEENPFEITGNSIISYADRGSAYGISGDGFDVIYADISNNVMKGEEVEEEGYEGEGGWVEGRSYFLPGIYSKNSYTTAIYLSTVSGDWSGLPTIGSIGSSFSPLSILNNEIITSTATTVFDLNAFYSIYADIISNKILVPFEGTHGGPTIASLENWYWNDGTASIGPPPAGKGLIKLNFTSNEMEFTEAGSGLLLKVKPENRASEYSYINMGSGSKGMGNNSVVYPKYIEEFYWKGNYGNNNEVYLYPYKMREHITP